MRRLGARTAYHWKTGGDAGGAAGGCRGTKAGGGRCGESGAGVSGRVVSVVMEETSEKVSASESIQLSDRAAAGKGGLGSDMVDARRVTSFVVGGIWSGGGEEGDGGGDGGRGMGCMYVCMLRWVLDSVQ